jgi:hypothetical protein
MRYFYAYQNKSYFLCNDTPSVFSLDLVNDANIVGLISDSKTLTVEEAWSNLSYLHGLRGYNALSSSVKQIRFEEEGIIKVVTKNEKTFRIKYGDVLLFDLANIEGLPEIFKEKIESYRVFDWFDVRSGAIHEHSLVQDEESDFVKKIHFFRSPRIDGNKDKKDLVCESKMTKRQIGSADYSDTIVRLKALQTMRDLGIKNPKIELWKRDVLPVKQANYIRHKKITYVGDTKPNEDN